MFNQNEIWLYDAATANLTRVTTASDGVDRDSMAPSISSDGSKVVFHSDSDFLGQGIPNNQNEIWLYDVATASLTRLTTASAGDRNSWVPAISADGSKVVFHSDSDFLGQGIPANQDEIWLYDIATANLTRVTTSDWARDSVNPAINGDGSKVVFHSDSDFLAQGIPADQDEIWLYDVASANLTRVTTASAGDRDSETPSINGDGSAVVFSSDSDFLGQGIPVDQDEIWLYDVASTNLTRVTTASAGDRASVNPAINGDGSTVVFSSDSDFLGQGIPNDQYEIWRVFYKPSLNEISLTVNKDGDGAGTVTSNPAGIDCGAACNMACGESDSVTLMGAPDAGSALDGWTGADCPGNGDCAVTVTADLTVTATFNPDTDGDGISDIVESAGPNNGDGNLDGVPDSEQADVATFQDINGNWCTLIAETGTTLAGVTATVNPSAADAPEGADFAYGFFGFSIQGLAPGGSTVATLIMHTQQTDLTGYYRYGPTPDNNAHHWYDFAFVGGTGAIITHPTTQTQVELSFIDGARGDDDLTADGIIVDLGGPAQSGGGGGGGGGGGSCFISVMP